MHTINKFLIHRVELKDVPSPQASLSRDWFLIHRVELKEVLEDSIFCSFKEFLIHRVELKVNQNP